MIPMGKEVVRLRLRLSGRKSPLARPSALLSPEEGDDS
jgi:hypothetical protein